MNTKTIEPNPQSPSAPEHNQPETADGNPDITRITNSKEIVTIAEARERLGPDAPTRDGFHKACKRGLLKKLPELENDKDFRFLWSDIVEWRERGKSIERLSSKQKRAKSSHTKTEADQPAATVLFAESEQALPPSTMLEVGSGVTYATSRETMNGKPVLYRDVKTVLTIPSDEFHEKLLCDGIVFNLGDACVFRCTYCYVESVMIKLDKALLDLHNKKTGQNLGFEDVVIRRRNSLEVLKSQLLKPDGTRIYDDPEDNRVAYSSTLVDVAANMELLEETAAACILILENTNWQIRLLSKSSLLMLLIKREMIPKQYHPRLILGFSIGTLDNKLASAIEVNTGVVSKRLTALQWLQDHGIRTFGMICPSLPQEDYDKFSREMCTAIRVEKCEHVWAEVINVRGESLTKTTAALGFAGYHGEARRLEAISGSEKQDAREDYARNTFLAHTKNVPPGKLRFLQYIDKNSADWWKDQRDAGAILLGAAANISQLTVGGESAPSEPLPALGQADIDYLAVREAIVDSGIKASIAAAKALHEIKTYRKGLLWKKNFRSFEQYLLVKWNYQKSQGYNLAEVGEFVAALVCKDSANAEKLPVSEGQLRGFFAAVPKEHRVACWTEITADKNPSELTGPMVAADAKKFARKNDLMIKSPKPEKVTAQARAQREMEKLRSALEKLPQPERFEQLLLGISMLIDQNPDEGVIEVAATEVEPATGPEPMDETRQSA